MIHGYDGVILGFGDLVGFTGADDTALGKLLLAVQTTLGAARTLGVAVPGARPTASLATALAGSNVVLHVTKVCASPLTPPAL